MEAGERFVEAAKNWELDLAKKIFFDSLPNPFPINYINKKGEKAIDFWKTGWAFNFIQFLVEQGHPLNEGEFNFIFKAIELRCEIDMLKFLINKGAYLGVEGETNAFHIAVQRGTFESVKFLSQFFTIDCKDENGNTPLNLLCQYCDSQSRLDICVSPCNNCLRKAFFLMENGADINSKNKFGSTPFASACVSGSDQLLLALMAYDVETDVCTDFGVRARKYYYENWGHGVITF